MPSRPEPGVSFRSPTVTERSEGARLTSRMLAIVLVLFVASASAAYGQTVKIGTATALTGLGALIAKAGVVGKIGRASCREECRSGWSEDQYNKNKGCTQQ